MSFSTHRSVADAPALPGLRDLCIIGRGSFAAVYRAIEDLTFREVAVKVLHREIDPQLVERSFLNEAAVLGAIGTHPNIVDLFRADRSPEGHPFLVMRYLDGGDLRAFVEEHGPLSWPQAADIVVSILDALRFAHARKVVHCDLKPANILLADERPVLIDFGVSRFIGPTRQPATSLGAWSFTAPECLRGEAPTPRSDLYALGAVAHLLLNGRPPVDLGRSTSADHAMATRRSAVIDGLPADVPARAADVLRSMIATAPDQRPASAESAMHQLAAVINPWTNDRMPMPEASGRSQTPAARPASINQWWRQT